MCLVQHPKPSYRCHSCTNSTSVYNSRLFSIFFHMTQFTESAAPSVSSLHPNGLGLCLDLGASKPSIFHGAGLLPTAFPVPSFSSKSFGLSFNSASCMEQLLLHCADAIESNDATLAQQILWVLNNIAPPDGDCNQRLTSAFLRALIARASKIGSCKTLTSAFASVDDEATNLALHTHRFTALELSSFVDLTPLHRFGYSAANAVIVEAVEGFSMVHIVDLSTTHCMQMPTLIDLLAKRPEGPPIIRLTVPSTITTTPPPLLDLSLEELGARLVNFARSRDVIMEFRVVPSDPCDAFDSLIEQLRLQQLLIEGEALVINCQMMLHYIPDETAICSDVVSSAMSITPPISLRSIFLNSIRSLQPIIVTAVDEDADFTACDVVGRMRSAFNYLWIPYDAVDTFLPKGSEQRRWFEAGVRWKIENLIAHEGLQRVERLEPKARWAQRMRSAGFRALGFGDDAAAEVKAMLDEHAVGWGLKMGEEDFVLTWKGHNVIFATAWAPS